MKTITKVIATCLLSGSSVVFAAGQGAGADTAPTPQLQEQNMIGQPSISGDGINNATQVDDLTDIGRTGNVPEDAPEPQPLEGDAGVQQAK